MKIKWVYIKMYFGNYTLKMNFNESMKMNVVWWWH